MHFQENKKSLKGIRHHPITSFRRQVLQPESILRNISNVVMDSGTNPERRNEVWDGRIPAAISKRRNEVWDGRIPAAISKRRNDAETTR